MPKYVNFTHPTNGTEYRNAYCELVVVGINKRNLQADIRFDIWDSKEKYDAQKNPVHDSSFMVTGAEFITAMIEETKHEKSVSEICYEHAATKLRVNPRDPLSDLLFATATDNPS